MKGLAIAHSWLLISFLLSVRVNAQELRLEIQRNSDETFTLSGLDGVLNRHTFIEFSTNGLWFPAYFTSSNATDARVYTVTNTGGTRLFKVTQGQTLASQVKESWQRLGVTNYAFHYSRSCLCDVHSATVTVMSNQVVKVENAKNRFGDFIENPSLSLAATIDRIFDQWILWEHQGAYARELRFDANGFPTFIYIDLFPRFVDDELYYTIDSFAPFP